MPSATSTLLSRLQHSGGQVVVLNAPPEFKPIMDRWRSDGLPVSQRRTPGSRFVLAFVYSCSDIERMAGAIVTSVGRDGALWFAYPKQTSQRYGSDITREDSWAVLSRMGYEGVRQVAVDDDWSALRFRHGQAAKASPRHHPPASEAERARPATARG
jgi:hypothetical protein